MRRRLHSDHAAIGLLLMLLIPALGASLDLWATDWREVSDVAWSLPSAEHWFGTNRIGQDVFARTVMSLATAFEIGLVVALGSVALGLLIGALSGYYQGRWVDEVLLWLTGCFDSIPNYLLVGAVLFVLQGSPAALQIALVMSFWPPIARLARIRVIALREQTFITAARVAGSRPLTMIRLHFVPHLRELMVVQAGLLCVAAIKAEVVLSFVGLSGLNAISFGRMLAEAGQDVLAGQYQNFLAASMTLVVLVGSLNRWIDQLQSGSSKILSTSPGHSGQQPKIEPV
ncbi:MAG: ABC transporter permease [Pseudomonadota bacterium]